MRSKAYRFQKIFVQGKSQLLLLLSIISPQTSVFCGLRYEELAYNVSFLVMSNNAPFLVMDNCFIKISTSTSFSNALQYYSEGKTPMVNQGIIICIIFQKRSYLFSLSAGSIHLVNQPKNMLEYLDTLCLLPSRYREGPNSSVCLFNYQFLQNMQTIFGNVFPHQPLLGYRMHRSV